VFHALRQAESCIEELDERASARLGEKSEASRLLGQARSELEFLRPEDVLDDLPGRLGSLQAAIRAVGEAVSTQYFHPTPWVAWANAQVLA
jgi:uncharacterized alpha-E superfamily protein